MNKCLYCCFYLSFCLLHDSQH